MKRFNCILLILVLGYSCFGVALFARIFHDRPLIYPAKGKWTLVWDDDFNGPALDQTKWTTGEGSDYSTYRRAVQTISRENITIQDGCLTLVNNYKSWRDNRMNDTVNLTSGQIATADRYAWTYGRFEIRAKLPPGEGIISYASLRPVDGTLSREILLMMMSGANWNTIFAHNNWGTKMIRHYIEEDQSVEGYTNYLDGFHTFALEWEPGVIRWYVDNINIYQTNRNVPETPFSLTVGTTAGNLSLYYHIPTSNRITADFPQYFTVDWVRIYQRR